MEPQISLEHIRRLARELAARRDAAYDEVRGEVEMMKASLRERASAIAERERELGELQERLGANGLAAELAGARRLKEQAEAELRLAQAERDRLDEREQQIRAVERELATLRTELGHKPSANWAERSDREKELDEREALLATREAAVAERERALGGETIAIPTPPE